MADHITLLKQAARYEHPESLPISIGILPAVWKKYPKEIREMTGEFSHIFGSLSQNYNYEQYTPATYHTGKHTDEWGCVWENIEEGMESYVTGHPIKNAEDIRNLQIPPNRDGRLPHGFMYLRLLDLCGFENAMMLFAEEQEELQILIDKVLEYNCLQIEAVVDKIGDMMFFGDDLGMQKGLAIGAKKWVKYLKPCFTRMYSIVKKTGRLVYMHTDGCIHEIMPHLQQAGVDMINPQYRANGLDNLVRVCKGKIPINLDLDRQLLPFATPSQIDDHVRECVEALYLPEGGLGLSLELAQDIPLENMYAAITAVDKYRFFKG
ncbi:MAG: uroporphyrinogen decarboxylase family protein [Eubacteriales bacterium]